MKINEINIERFADEYIEDWIESCIQKYGYQVLFHNSGSKFSKFNNRSLSKENDTGFHFAIDSDILAIIHDFRDRSKSHLYCIDATPFRFLEIDEDLIDFTEDMLLVSLVRMNRNNTLESTVPKKIRNFLTQWQERLIGNGPYFDKKDTQMIIRERVGTNVILKSGFHGFRYENDEETSFRGGDNTSFVILRQLSDQIKILDRKTV